MNGAEEMKLPEASLISINFTPCNEGRIGKTRNACDVLNDPFFDFIANTHKKLISRSQCKKMQS